MLSLPGMTCATAVTAVAYLLRVHFLYISCCKADAVLYIWFMLFMASSVRISRCRAAESGA
jgi:hypothetical protein